MKYVALKRTVSFWMTLALLLALFAYASVPREMKAQSSPVCFFQHTNYTGTSFCSGTGTFNVMPSGWNDYISSLQVQSGYKVVVYQHGYLGGTALTFTAWDANLVDNNFNDVISSYVITSNSGGSCQTWQYGVNYSPVGTVVRYPNNGRYYKLVNVGGSGHSDGTDPTISTWYWQETSACSGGGTTPPPPSGGCDTFSQVFTEAMFNSAFSSRSGFYTYQGLVNAAAAYPSFGRTGDCAMRRREVAAAMANFHHETGGLYYVTEINKGNDLCDESRPYGCPAGTYGYYGRGPIQLSWNFNYYAAGNALGYGNDLLNNPYRVEQDATIAWKTALWFWMTQSGAGYRPAHDSIVNNYGFGETIRSINGSIECNGGNPAQVTSRIQKFDTILGIVGSSRGAGNVSC